MHWTFFHLRQVPVNMMIDEVLQGYAYASSGERISYDTISITVGLHDGLSTLKRIRLCSVRRLSSKWTRSAAVRFVVLLLRYQSSHHDRWVMVRGYALDYQEYLSVEFFCTLMLWFSTNLYSLTRVYSRQEIAWISRWRLYLYLVPQCAGDGRTFLNQF